MKIMLSPRFKNDGKPIYKLNEIQLQAKADVELKIEKGQYEFEEINCAACKSNEYELLAEKDRYGLTYYTVICKNCGLVYVSPRMTEKAYAEFYNAEYRKLYVGVEAPRAKFFIKQTNRGKRILKFVNKHYKFNNKTIDVLEVGCGAGGILEVFKQAGHNVVGIDLDEKYLNYGKEKFGLNLISSTINDLDENIKADLIIYAHVLEHILDLDKELAMIKKHLKPDGIVYIEVPGVRYVHKTSEMDFLKYLQNAHVFHFSLNSLNRIFYNNGFKNICGNEYIRALYKQCDKKQDIAYTNEYSKVLNYLTKTEKNLYSFIFWIKKPFWIIKKLYKKYIKE